MTTRSDLGTLANARLQREHRLRDPQEPSDAEIIPEITQGEVEEKDGAPTVEADRVDSKELKSEARGNGETSSAADDESRLPIWNLWTRRIFHVLRTYCKFVGPGFMISVVSI